MSKKSIITIVLIALVLIMVIDFRINKAQVFVNYGRQLETDSILEITDDTYNGIGYLSGSLDGKPETVKNETVMLETAEMGIHELVINNPIGSVIISGQERQGVAVDYKITVYTSRELTEDDLELFREIKLTQEIHGKALELGYERVSLPSYINGIKVDYNILVPQQLKLNINNRHGKLIVSNMDNDVKLSNSYDRMQLENIAGKAELLVRYGSLFAFQIEGPVRVNSSYSDIEGLDLDGELEIDSSYASISLNNIGADVDINISYGNLDINNLEGDFVFTARYSRVNGEEIRDKISGDMYHSDLKLYRFRDNVDIKGNYSNYRLRLADDLKDYQLSCSTEYGNIISNISNELIEERNKKKLDIVRGNGEYRIDLETRHGDIHINQ